MRRLSIIFALAALCLPVSAQAATRVSAFYYPWYATSAHDGSYEHSGAIRLMDAWWKPLLHAEFEPTLGGSLFDQIADISVLDDSPNLHLGSAYNGGWYVYANKDLRTMVAKVKGRRALRKIDGRYSRIYCGKGKLRRCRKALLNSLVSALGKDPYGSEATPNCKLGSRQMCFDAIRFRSTGGITQPDMVWQNRPTFQQAVQVQGHR